MYWSILSFVIASTPPRRVLPAFSVGLKQLWEAHVFILTC